VYNEQYSLFGADFIKKISQFENDNILGLMLYTLLNAVMGTNTYNSNKWLQISSSWSPARASVKEAIHYGQMIKSETFQEWDYMDKKLNQEHYGQDTPPIVNIGKIRKVPIAMYVGMQDPLANYMDTRWIRDSISSVMSYTEIYDFDHSSFLSGTNMTYVDDVIDHMKEFNP